MRHFVAPFTRAESDETAARIRALMAEQGYGLWAVEVVGVAEFIGFVGLNTPRFETTFTPCVEIGWRLSRAHHGRGYATEAALACLEHGFAVLGLDEILSFTTVRNAASRRVMEKIGMYRDAKNDFDHPSVPECHPIRPHVLYRLGWVDWEARGAADGAEDRSESV